MDLSLFRFIYISFACQILDFFFQETKHCFGPGSEGNELGSFSHNSSKANELKWCFLVAPSWFLRAASACASRAIGALLSSYFFIGRFGWTSPLFPNEKGERAFSHRDVDSFSAPNEMGISYLFPFIFMNGIKARLASFQQPTAGSTSVYDRAQ